MPLSAGLRVLLLVLALGIGIRLCPSTPDHTYVMSCALVSTYCVCYSTVCTFCHGPACCSVHSRGAVSASPWHLLRVSRTSPEPLLAFLQLLCLFSPYSMFFTSCLLPLVALFPFPVFRLSAGPCVPFSVLCFRHGMLAWSFALFWLEVILPGWCFRIRVFIHTLSPFFGSALSLFFCLYILGRLSCLLFSFLSSSHLCCWVVVRVGLRPCVLSPFAAWYTRFSRHVFTGPRSRHSRPLGCIGGLSGSLCLADLWVLALV